MNAKLILIHVSILTIIFGFSIAEKEVKDPHKTEQLKKPFINAIFYSSKIEIPGYRSRELYFDIDPKFENCNITLEFFSLYHFIDKDRSHSLRTAIDVMGPENSVILRDLYQLDGGFNSKPIKENFRLKKHGNYLIAIRNMEAAVIMANLVMRFEECHEVKHDLKKDS